MILISTRRGIEIFQHDKPVHLAARAELADPEALKMILDHPNCSADDVAENGSTENRLCTIFVIVLTIESMRLQK